MVDRLWLFPPAPFVEFPMVQAFSLAALLALVILSAGAEGQDFAPEDIEFFEAKIRPLLVEHCFDCHSTDARQVKAGLYLDSRDGILVGGESGPAAVVGKPDESVFLDAVKYKSFEMPPDRKLSDGQIAVLTQWIEKGLPWPQATVVSGRPISEVNIDWEKMKRSHWAWQSVKRPPVPAKVSSADDPLADNPLAKDPLAEGPENCHPVDAFVSARRSQSGIEPSSLADASQLVRRIYLDLWGIPPTPEQVAEFSSRVNINRDRAVEQLIDELLGSARYGQRWGRHWLDVARYSDGFGGFLDSAELDNAWRYRDWVVNAFNEDMPYDRFLHLQIAGDLQSEHQLAIATGFFAIGPSYRSDGGDPDSEAQAIAETLDDRVDTLCRGILAITVSCSRCHDHKFDPIPQKDYYSLAGVFKNTSVHRLDLSPEAIVKTFNEHAAAIKSLNGKIKQHKGEAHKAEREALEAELEELKRHAPPAPEQAHALRESGDSDMKVALRGNPRKQGDVAPRRFLRVIAGAEPSRFKHGSGRSELAAAIIDPDNPLTARVFVNRVWQHHFGEGLVRTLDNFGALGEPPTHPELLDYLASEFVAQGWSIKKLHRLMMTSRTYQLSSQHIRKSFEADGENRWLWRMNPKRMDVETWRDSLLAVTGELDWKLDGPPIDDIASSNRRTLYARVSRNGDVFPSDAFLRRFDFPSMRTTVAKRPQSVVPQQYLFLLNSEFMLARAQALATRLMTESGSDEERIRHAYRLLLSREPSDHEVEIGAQFVRSSTEENGLAPWVQYAQVMLSSNEFMFVR